MLFGKLLEGVNNEIEENELTEMEQDLRSGIERSKAMIAACKTGVDDDAAFLINADGVTLFSLSNSFIPTSNLKSTIMRNFGRLILKIKSVSHSLKKCPKPRLSYSNKFRNSKYTFCY